MSGTRPTVYWDACVLLSWLLEDLPDDRQAELSAMMRMVEGDKVRLLTSAITYTEVLTSPLPDRRFRERFIRFMNRANVLAPHVTIKVAQKAGELRRYYMDHPKGRKDRPLKLSTPDALHLATAILHRADEFQTYDERDGRGTIGLLGLDGNVAGHRLRVCIPHGEPQKGLFD